jgi:hypothetical protein
MATTAADQQAVPALELARRRFIGELESGLALEETHPFVFGLVVPETGWTARRTGMNAFQPQMRRAQEHIHGLATRGGHGATQQ